MEVVGMDEVEEVKGGKFQHLKLQSVFGRHGLTISS